MFKQVIDIVRQVLFLNRDVTQTKDDVAQLKEQLAKTNETLREISFELQRLAEREHSERERIVLTIESRLLRYERDARVKKLK